MRFLFLLFLLISLQVSSQDFGTYISNNAIDFSDSLAIYEKIKSYDLIMVGEMHGTNEPAELVALIRDLLLIFSKDSVSLGLEIPSSEMKMYLEQPSDSSLRNSTFFSNENIDGRNGKAWFDLIQSSATSPKVDLFFFDNYEELKIQNRDSAMYLGVVSQKKKFPNRKIITLSGNLHNSLISFGKMKTMGSYFQKDSLNFSSICSINHYYSEGEMYNNQGDGIQLRQVSFKESVFFRSSKLENYLIFYQSVNPSPNNCVLYTRKVSASKVLKVR